METSYSTLAYAVQAAVHFAPVARRADRESPLRRFRKRLPVDDRLPLARRARDELLPRAFRARDCS